MKRILIYAVGLLLAFSACKVENDYIFDDISTYRLSQYIEECDQMLTKEEWGWKFIYYPEEETYGGYTFLLKFSKKDPTSARGSRVEMQSDLYIEPTGNIQAVPEKTISSYSYGVSLGPVLSFDTYSLLHYLSDPSPDVYGGKSGVGYNGEFEFLITGVDAVKKELTLLGKQYKREAKMVAATAEDWLTLNDQRKKIRDFKVDPTLPFYQYLIVGTDTAFFNYSSSLRMAYMTYVKDGKTVAESYPVYSTVEGLKFKNKATLGGLEFDEIRYNTNTKLIEIVNPEAVGQYRMIRASSPTENCLLRFPGAVDMAKGYADGFSMIERGVELTLNGSMDLFPSGHDIKEFRVYWNLVGKHAAEIYCRPNETLAATYARLYDAGVASDNVGDKVHFQFIAQTYYTGAVTDDVNQWFGFNFSVAYLFDVDRIRGGALHNYMTNMEKINGVVVNKGHTVIPVGKQFYMIQNGNNRAWGLYTPLQLSRF